ncbi:MAG: hypothetical protein C5B52_12600 [Bacteroidetes bacterium]|nr:MAG: hypothetical protein C5B52_12600 [Bacteroidota bacterium]
MKEHNIWRKIREFLVEVFIIVFAITLSIWFHNRSEHSQQQDEVKEFLLGLKSDLEHDLVEMANDKESYERQKYIFSYVTSPNLKGGLNKDTLRENRSWLFNTTALSPNNGRFEGFKSSGHIGQIENKELQNDIMDFYQEDIVTLLSSTDAYIMIKRKFFDFEIQNLKRTSDSTNNLIEILLLDQAQNLCGALRYPNEVISRYETCMAKARKIINEIKAEYDLKN